MADAWNSEDTNMAVQNNGSAPTADGWSGGGAPGDERGRSPNGAPSGGQNGGYRRNSRSRSPGAPPPRNDDRQSRGDGPGGNNPGNNLHVSGLSSRVDNRDLEAAFAKYGKVAKAAVMYDPHTRESRGFGFVTMESAADADACIAALNGTDLKGRSLSIEKARRGRARTPTPGRYFGPPKRVDGEDATHYERPYDPRPYDSRYSDRGPRRDDRRYDDRGDRRRDYDRSRYDRDYDRRY